MLVGMHLDNFALHVTSFEYQGCAVAVTLYEIRLCWLVQFDVQSHRRSVVTFSVQVQAMSILSVKVDCGVAAD